MRRLVRLAAFAAVLACACVLSTAANVAAESVGFDSEQWVRRGGEVLEYSGRESMSGFAFLDGVNLENGVVEVDLIATGATSYPGIVFRLEDERNYEWIYIRPHRANQYPDAVQYAPHFNGTSSWQLCNGDGFTAPIEFPENEWVHLRLEFADGQAKLFVGDATEPVLHVEELKRGPTGGSVGINCPAGGSAYFSNFEYRDGSDLAFESIPPAETSPGTVATWEISQAFQMGLVDISKPYEEQELPEELVWTTVEAEPSGLLDIARYRSRTGNQPDCVFARTILDAEEAKTLNLQFGYSDAVTIFLNGVAIYTGANAYRQRDPTSLGIIGLFDSVYLHLEEGENELVMLAIESFGGWGLMAQDASAVYLAEGVEQAFEVSDVMTPEAVVYDESRDEFYVSNYDAYRLSAMTGGQYVSRLSGDGEVLDAQWVGGLAQPTGMLVDGGTLYVVERTGLVEVDVESGEIRERHPIPGAGFPNDVAADDSGRLYVTDSRASAIHRFEDGAFEVWMSGGEVSDPNAIMIDGGTLYLGNNGDGSLKYIDIETGVTATLARFREGNIDGIRKASDGSLLVSHWEGRVYRVSPDGTIEKLIDTSVRGRYAADFEYVASKNMVVLPAFYADEVIGYTLGE